MTKGTEKIKDKASRGRKAKEKLTPISDKLQSTYKVRHLNSEQCSSDCQSLHGKITQIRDKLCNNLMSINYERI